MERFGFVRIAVARHRVSLADPAGNAASIDALWAEAEQDGCDILVTPELSLSGYSCGDLFAQDCLLDAVRHALEGLREASRARASLAVVGLPLRLGGKLYNTAAVLHRGRILGVVPKAHLPNYREFYEQRWFLPGDPQVPPERILLCGEEVLFGVDLLFEVVDVPGLVVAAEICEDLWVPQPPSGRAAMAGATVLLNLSGSNEATGKAAYRYDLVVGQSARCIAAYAYAGTGVGESSTDIVFGGDGLIAENGRLLARAERFVREPGLLISDVDVERLVADRGRMGSFHQSDADASTYEAVRLELGPRRARDLRYPVSAHPFVPPKAGDLEERCGEIFAIQTAGLAQRLEAARISDVVIGVSGGLDSTLALLVAVRTFDLLGRDRARIRGITMPGFGTSTRTRTNANELMARLGVTSESIDIRVLSREIFGSLDHQPFGIDLSGRTPDEMRAVLAEIPPELRHDLTFENVQARLRTLLLMSRGFVIGTGDLSELALGWCTYNADHMSMYNPNVGIPKTLVRFLVEYVADHEFEGETRAVLHSIAETEISPELLPIGKNEELQSTEGTIGPYELHDFFLHCTIRFGMTPRKVLFLAERAEFDGQYSRPVLKQWLATFYRRFFQSQFKRSCLPDGPKVGSVTLSPRGDWRMPSDANVAAWLADLESTADD